MALFKTKKEKEKEREAAYIKAVDEQRKPPTSAQRLLVHQREKADVARGIKPRTGDEIGKLWKKSQEAQKKKAATATKSKKKAK